RRHRSLLLLALVLAGGTAQAATIGVGTADDPPGLGSSRCALRDAVEAANTDQPQGWCPAGSGADTIVFARWVEAVTLQSELVIEGDDGLTIDGRNDRVVLQ